MTLTVDQIDRWDPAAVREVADAARSRAQAALAAAQGLAGLPCLTGWGGRSAAVGKAAIARTRRDLEAHARDASAVADAADGAVEGIEAVQRDVHLLRIEAVALGLHIDGSTNRITTIPGGLVPLMLHTVAAPLLQMQLNDIVREADSLDAVLATALGLGGGVPSAPADVPPIPDPPDDPAAFCDFWRALSRPQRDLLYACEHGIGNHPGMPAGTEDDPGADHYNRLHLAQDLAAGAGDRPDLEALGEALRDPNHLLLFYDPAGGDQVHAAVAVGNPDSAAHVSVTTPGLNTTVRENLGEMVDEAEALRRESLRQLGDAGRPGEDVAAVAWMGYDSPQIPGPELGVRPGFPFVPGLPVTANPLAVAKSVVGAYRVSHDDAARTGARDLARFYDGITAAHGGRPLNLTAIGHSYGSLTTGLALQQPGDHGVSNAIFYGSPGIEATTPADLGLQPGRVFVMETSDDPIQAAFTAPLAVRGLSPVIPGPLDDALLAFADATHAGEFGPNPAANPNFVRLETGPVGLMGPDGVLRFDGAAGHSEYPEDGSTLAPDGTPLLRTPGYNIAAVVAGLSERAFRGD